MTYEIPKRVWLVGILVSALCCWELSLEGENVQCCSALLALKALVGEREGRKRTK